MNEPEPKSKGFETSNKFEENFSEPKFLEVASLVTNVPIVVSVLSFLIISAKTKRHNTCTTQEECKVNVWYIGTLSEYFGRLMTG